MKLERDDMDRLRWHGRDHQYIQVRGESLHVWSYSSSNCCLATTSPLVEHWTYREGNHTAVKEAGDEATS